MKSISLAGAIIAIALPASASQIFVTPTGATTSGGAVNAQATFTASAGSLSVTLVDLFANPTDVAQLLSDLDFTVSLTGTTTLTSSGSLITVNADGSTTAGATGSTGWTFSSLGGNNYTLCDICGGGSGPANLIIGPGPYTNANGSIAGNGPHNPFINQTATFTLSNSSITADTTVSNVVFSFGTVSGINVPGGPPQGDVPGGVPEPATAALGGIGLVLTAVGVRARRRAQK
jgi:hypothetical protein